METRRRLGAVGLAGVFFAAAWAVSAPEPSVDTRSAAEPFALPNVTIVDPVAGRRHGVDVRIAGDRIEVISPRRSSPPADGRFAGATVLPGLIDMHVHYWSEEPEIFGLLLLLHGVTTVRDVGDSEDAIFDTRRRIERGILPGPRILACGPFVDGARPRWPGSLTVETRNHARRAVSELARRGADCVKAYRGLSSDALAALRDAAAETNLPVIGHVPDGMSLEESGIADVQHLTGVPAARSRGSSADGRTRFRSWSEQWRSLDDARIDEVIRVSVERGIAHTPTLVFWERTFRLAGAGAGPSATHIPWDHRALFWPPERPWNRTARDEAELEATLGRMKSLVGRLAKAGVRIHAGTDALNPFVVPGASLHDELRHLVDAGMSAADALAAATGAAAASLGRPDLGTVREGAAADLLIFRADPTRDLDALSTLEAVVSGGRLYTVDAIRDELERLGPAGSIRAQVSAAARRLAGALGLSERKL